MNTVLFAFLMLLLPKPANVPQKITFPSKDGLLITADVYENGENMPWILFCHQAGYSRGEYKDIVNDIGGKGFNCMVVDLRSGKEANGVVNETAARAAEKKLPMGYMDAKQDMDAALDYIVNKYNQKVILFGSSYSAGLALVFAAEDSRVKAAVAFSPGEYYGKSLSLRQKIAKMNKPVWVACSKEEGPATTALMKDIPNVTLYIPNTAGFHGASVLWADKPDNEGYWISVKTFLNTLK